MEKVEFVLLAIPIIIALVLNIIYPEEMLVFGRKWQFKNDNLEPSEGAIKYIRIGSIISLILLGIVIVFL